MIKIDKLLILLENLNLTLDPNFFTDNLELRSNIRDTLLELSDEVINSIHKDYDINITPSFIVVTGSLCGYNWDEYSDVDFHIVFDYNQIQLDKRELVKKTLLLYAQRWNQNKYILHDRSLEVYFQDVNEKHEAPGIYDIVHNHWIKEPSGADIKTNGNITVAADKYLADVQIMTDVYLAEPNKTQEYISNTLNDIKQYWSSIRDMRKVSLKNDGLYGMGNLIFRALRRNNTMQMIVDFMRNLKNDSINV